jgi:proline iminopeptidase
MINDFLSGMKLVLALMVVLAAQAATASATKLNGLYVNTFGDPDAEALVFIHGGPGYDSQNFELSTAEALSKKGYYVVVYDQRGQGRSDEAADIGEYSYPQYSSDLKNLIAELHLHKPVLIGHSHGGTIAIKFDQAYPGIAQKIVLVDAPINFWSSMESIFDNCSARYVNSGDSATLEELKTSFYGMMAVPTSSDEYLDQLTRVVNFFSHALKCGKKGGLYTPAIVTPEAQIMYQQVSQNLTEASPQNLAYPLAGFLFTENYIRLDNTDWVRAHATRYFGIYAAEDGLFSEKALASTAQAFTSNPSQAAFQVIPGASHNVFIDQQILFINALQRALRTEPKALNE